MAQWRGPAGADGRPARAPPFMEPVCHGAGAVASPTGARTARRRHRPERPRREGVLLAKVEGGIHNVSDRSARDGCARAGADCVVLGACRRVGGDVPWLWQGRRQARITQRLHVGELEPEQYFLGVGGSFQDLVRRTKSRLRGSRERSGGASGRAQPVGNAQRARRRLAGLARRAGRGRAKCT